MAEPMDLHRFSHLNPDSWLSRRRRQRMLPFLPLLESFPEPVRILDVGGTAAFWRNNTPRLGRQCRWTLLNLEREGVEGLEGAEAVAGDARDLSGFGDDSFDICFSNSVIEHVGTLYDQIAMAKEVRRVAKAYYVQTPNRHFPLEPHFLFPGWVVLPHWLRAKLLNRFRIGWWPREPDPILARAEVEQIRLLDAREVEYLFPEATVHRERVGPLVKGFVAISGGVA